MGFSTILLVMFGVIFGISRVAIAIATQAGFDLLGIVSWNLTYEIILIFVTVVSLILIAKRKLLGSIIYLISYLLYFGYDLLSRVIILMSTERLLLENITNVLVSFVGIILAISVFLDAIVLKAKKGTPNHKKTDWFYDNKDFDRKFDDRADRNEYKF